LIAETLYLENQALIALLPANQSKVDAELRLAKATLDQGDADVTTGNYGGAMKNYADSWDHTEKAIAIAAQTN